MSEGIGESVVSLVIIFKFHYSIPLRSYQTDHFLYRSEETTRIAMNTSA